MEPLLNRPARLTSSLICVLALFSLGSSALAQNITEKSYAFSPQAKTIVDRLATFDSIPADTWQYHLGDLAHGERPDLDTTGWQTIHPPFVAPHDAIWLRSWVEVPKTVHGYDLGGSQIWFSMKANANGPVPVILYYNGKRVAMGDDLEKQLLFDDAKPGEKVLIAVKMLATQDDKQIQSASLQVVFAPNRPNPEDLRDELISAADVLPSIPQNAATLASQEQTLDSAATSVNMAALDQGNQAAFDASLQQAQSNSSLCGRTLQQSDIHLTGNSHIDAAWLWPWTETVDVVKRTFDRAAVDERISQLHLHAIRRAVQRVDRGQISRTSSADQAAHQRRPMGDRRRHVGRARPEHAGWRIAGAPDSGRQG